MTSPQNLSRSSPAPRARQGAQTKSQTGDVVDVTYPVKLSPNTLEKLRARKDETKVPVTVQIRAASEKEVEKEVVSGPNAPIDLDRIAAAIAQKTAEKILPKIDKKESLCLDLSQSDKKNLQTVAGSLGFQGSAQMIEELAKWALKEPELLSALVFKNAAKTRRISPTETDLSREIERRRAATREGAPRSSAPRAKKAA